MKMKKKGKIIVISISSILILMSCLLGIYAYGIFHRVTYSTLLNTASREERWLSDLNLVKGELPKKHKNLFFSKTKTEFIKDMDSLISNIKKYNDIEIKSELARIINSVNDSHTRVDIQGTLLYPLSFFEFEEGIYLSNSSLEYKDFWGKRLVSINGYSIDALRSKLKPFISHDNQSIIMNEFCNLLKYVETLKIAGIAEEDAAVFTFEDGTKTDITVKPLEKDKYMEEKFLTDIPEYLRNFPITKRNMDKNYWYDYNESMDTVYVKYNSCSNTSGYSFNSFTKDVFNIIDQKNTRALIIDLRDNGGGNSLIFNPFIRAIREHGNINKKGSLFVIIGRRTFSSAILNAMDLRNGTHATLIGEPSGGKPNHFGEVKTLHLSNVNVDIYYSSNYFKTTKEDTDAVYPDVSIHSRASSYFSGQDDCMDYIYSRVASETNK